MVKSKPLRKILSCWARGDWFLKLRTFLKTWTLTNLPLKLLIAPVITSLLVLSTGCVVGPDMGAPQPAILANEYFSNLHNDNPRQPIEQWWQSFSDEKMNVLLARAEQQNPSIKQAYHRIAAARANVCLQGGSLLPNGDLLADYAFTKQSQNARPFVGQNGDPFDLFSLGLASTWEIDLFGRIERTIQAAEADLSFQKFDFQFVRQTLFSNIASSYLRIRLIQSQIDLANESLEIQSGTIQLVAQREEAGLSTKLDKSQTESFQFRSRALKAILEQNLELEFNQLAVLLGQQSDQELRNFIGRSPMPEIPAVPEVGIPAELLRRRPDVRREEMAVARAGAEIGIAEADLYPQLALLGTISVSARNVSGLFETDGLGFSVGPSFRWNILHFDRINNNIDIQNAEFQQAIAQYQTTVLAAAREVEDSLIRHQGALNQWSELTSAIAADETAVELSLERYRAGKANFQRVLDAQQQLLQDRQLGAQARIEAVDQIVRLYRSAGGSWEFMNYRPHNQMVSSQPKNPQSQESFSPVKDFDTFSELPDLTKPPTQLRNQFQSEQDDQTPPTPTDNSKSRSKNETTLYGNEFELNLEGLNGESNNLPSAPVVELEMNRENGFDANRGRNDLSSIPVVELEMNNGSLKVKRQQRYSDRNSGFSGTTPDPSIQATSLLNGNGVQPPQLPSQSNGTPFVTPHGQMPNMGSIPTQTAGYPLFEFE
ncbi:MAG: efflux transporter outer membrane subunit [Mariniblastus sp.]